MRFSETVKRNDPELIVSRRHDAWLEQNNNPVYSSRAKGFAMRQLSGKDRKRKGTVSASSLDSCPRYQQFVYIGMPCQPSDTQGVMRMHNGSFMHLRWQMAGLSEGWLKRAEVPVRSEEHRIQGTMDGVLYDDSILELKSINSHGFSRVQAFGPLTPHLFQMATYMLCSGRDKGVFIYECKDNQEYKEVIVTNEQVPLLGVKQRAQEIWRHIESKTLFEPLEKCIDREGWQYNSCPFRDQCLGIHEWQEVSDE